MGLFDVFKKIGRGLGKAVSFVGKPIVEGVEKAGKFIGKTAKKVIPKPVRDAVGKAWDKVKDIGVNVPLIGKVSLGELTSDIKERVNAVGKGLKTGDPIDLLKANAAIIGNLPTESKMQIWKRGAQNKINERVKQKMQSIK